MFFGKTMNLDLLLADWVAADVAAEDAEKALRFLCGVTSSEKRAELRAFALLCRQHSDRIFRAAMAHLDREAA